MNPTAHEGKIGDIQVLRGIAILMVLVYHLSISATALGALPVRVTLPLYLGVEIFFVVSGYVITRSLIKDDYHGIRFFIKRIFRLTPALLCFIGLTLLLNRYIQEADVSDVGKSLMSVPNHVFRQQARAVAFGYLTVLPTNASFANGAMWSLSVEDQFYAGTTILCVALGALGLPVRSRGPILATTACALYVLITAERLFGWCDGEGVLSTVFRYIVHWRFDFLALGVVLVFADRRFGPRIREYFQHSGNFCSAFLLVLPVTFAAVCESPLDSNPAVLDSIGYSSMGLCFGGLVVLAANGLAFPASRGIIYKLTRLVGDRSYTYYLFHYPMFIVAWSIFFKMYPAAFDSAWRYAIAQLVAVTALLVPFSEIVYRCVELPLANFGRKLASRLFRSQDQEALGRLLKLHDDTQVTTASLSSGSRDDASSGTTVRAAA